ncbi:MAG: hypothetical protein GY711_27700 [bacterium]|nr:hypothetical protein [bacterium]
MSRSGELVPACAGRLGLDPEAGSSALTDFFDLQPNRWLRVVPGRGTFAWPLEGPPTAIVKRFRGDGWKERLYGLRTADVRSPAQREFDNLRRLAADRIRVPGAIGWVEHGDRSLVAMEHVPHQETLKELLAGAEPHEVRGLLERLLELVRALHGQGWYHRDLYLQHILVTAGELCLIDVGRARRRRSPRRRWFIKDVGALLASMPESVPRAAFERFLAGYLDGRGIASASERRWWARSVEARARRIRAHVPRHGEEGDLPPPLLP